MINPPITGGLTNSHRSSIARVDCFGHNLQDFSVQFTEVLLLLKSNIGFIIFPHVIGLRVKGYIWQL